MLAETVPLKKKNISWKVHFSQTVLGSKVSYQANDNEEIILLIFKIALIIIIYHLQILETILLCLLAQKLIQST